MNVKMWFVGLFSGNQTNEGLATVRRAGREDGREHAAHYADGFLDGVSDVLMERLNGFKVIETTAVAKSDAPRIAAKTTTRRTASAK